jgi:hypothetical protein
MANGIDDFDGITQPFGDQPWTVDHPNTDLNVPDDNSSLSTGDLRRKYNFGNAYTTLSAKRDPFLHLLNRIKGGKVPTDDPKFKFTTKRACGPQHRYGYVVDADAMARPADQAAYATAVGSFSSDLTNGELTSTDVDKGDFIVLKIEGDSLYQGNKRNVYKQVNGKVALGANDSAPRYFLKDQVVKVNTKAAVGTNPETNDYLLVKVEFDPVFATNDTHVYVGGSVVKETSSFVLSTALTNSTFLAESYDKSPTDLEPYRCYPVGSAYHELSGYGAGWKDQPWSTEYGFTQIFKTTMMMSNRAQATVLKYEPSEWKRVWGGKLREHAWDVAQAGYFGVQDEDAEGVTFTQGAVDYILNNGNSFTWSNNYTVDDFMNDMSIYKDPRTDLGGNIAYFCNSEVWNWMQKQSGFLKNNSEISTNFEFQLVGRGIAKGIPFSKISTVYGDLNLMRDVHLDGTNIKILAINLNGARFRPLVGNGKNRDTTVHVGVKTIENSGEDYRVDLIQTDAGFEFSLPETHAIWL